MVPDPGHPPKAACGLRALKNDTLLGYGWTSLHSPSCHGANHGWWVSDCEAHLHTSIKLITGVHSAAAKHRKELNPSLPEMLRGWFRYWQWSLVPMALVNQSNPNLVPPWSIRWGETSVEVRKCTELWGRRLKPPPSPSGAANKEVSSAGCQFGSCCSGAGPSHTAIRYCLQRRHKLNSTEKN